MTRLFQLLHAELLKLFYYRVTRIVIVLIIFLQSVLAYIAAKQILAVGLDATPETNVSLAEKIPPIDYLGFDAIGLGLLPIIILGAFYGAVEYKSHGLRTTLLSTGSKKLTFVTKTIAIATTSLLLSFFSIYTTIAITHIALGKEGLNPLLLNQAVWQYIWFGMLSWTLLTTLAYVIGYLFRTSIVPLLFLIPQVYNLGEFLAQRFTLCKYLPVALGNQLIATSETALSKFPSRTIGFLLIWIMLFGILSYQRFMRSDLGGAY